MKKIFRSFIVLPLIIALALAFVVYKVKSREPLQHQSAQLSARSVEVITVKKLPFRTRAMAYGHVEPSRVLKARSEVNGKISYVHPELKQGGSLPADTVVVRIEPTTFEFSLDASQAGLANTRSSLAQVEAEEASTRRSLQIAKKNLEVGQKELKRVRSLWDKRIIPQTTLDAEEQKVLQLQSSVETLQGKMDTYASRKAAIKAQIRQSSSEVERSKDTLGRTEISLPFDARIGAVQVEAGEFVSVGGQLFEALGVDAVEINAQLAIRHVRPLARAMSDNSSNNNNPEKTLDLRRAIADWNLEAKVRLVGDSGDASWDARLLRVSESIDPSRDTLGLVVAVDNPYQGVVPGRRPPLLKGMYVSVEFLTRAEEKLVIPRSALHQGRVYRVGEQNQLEIRPVAVEQTQGQLAVVTAGLDAGDRIVISDLIPVIEGMPLEPVPLKSLENSLVSLANGKGSSQSPLQAEVEDTVDKDSADKSSAAKMKNQP